MYDGGELSGIELIQELVCLLFFVRGCHQEQFTNLKRGSPAIRTQFSRPPISHRFAYANVWATRRGIAIRAEAVAAIGQSSHFGAINSSTKHCPEAWYLYLLLATRRHLYLLHKGLTERNDFCSDVLEQMLDTALVRAGASFLSRFPSPKLPASRPLDFVADIGGTRFGGEAKNYREWIYPDSSEIWSAISKCCELDAVPVLITRKLPYISFLLFRNIGMVGYQTHFQFFHPIVEPELARVKHVAGLGYKDIHCVTEPDANMINFFKTTLPRIGPDFQQRFASHKLLLQHFADDEKLRDDSLNPKVRQKVFAQAWKALVGRDLSDDLTV